MQKIISPGGPVYDRVCGVSLVGEDLNVVGGVAAAAAAAAILRGLPLCTVEQLSFKLGASCNISFKSFSNVSSSLSDVPLGTACCGVSADMASGKK